MFSRYILVAVCFFTNLTNIPASSECEDVPEFTPSLLVVKYRDPATATCSVCNGSCNYTLRLEEPFRAEFKNGRDVIWKVTHMDQWDTSALCYYNSNGGKQCLQTLDVIVYQPPESVSVSFRNHSGPLKEEQLYSVQCEVKDVAPAQKLTVVFYIDQVVLQEQSSNITLKSPVTESFRTDYRASREDHGAQFWCEARLELGPEGPQPPPVVRSHNMTATVHYRPYNEGPSDDIQISVTQGHSVQLNCSAKGNPSPHYSWTIPWDQHTLFSHSLFTVDSATSSHEGHYHCNATNEAGSFMMTFTVKVEVNYVHVIVGVVAVVLALAAIGFSIVYIMYYRHSHMDQYNLRDVFHFRRHVAVPVSP